VKDGKLENSRGGNLVAVSENKFMLGANRIEILQSKPKKVLFISPTDTIHYYAVDSASADANALNEYTDITLKKLKRFIVLVKDGKLIAHQNLNRIIRSPVYKDGSAFRVPSFIFPATRRNASRAWTLCRPGEEHFHKTQPQIGGI
jgi:hypothetical protein